MVSMILCTDMNYRLYDEPIPIDRKLFYQWTVGKVVIMGRKTQMELPGARLKRRFNIVVSRDREYVVPGVVSCDSITSALELGREVCKGLDSEEIIIIGGASVYNSVMRMGLVDRVYHGQTWKDGAIGKEPIEGIEGMEIQLVHQYPELQYQFTIRGTKW